MSRSHNSGSGCLGVLITLMIGGVIGMLFLAIFMGFLTIGLTERDGGFDLSFDVSSDLSEGPE